MPEEGCSNLIPHREILTFEEIIKVAEAAASMGIHKLRLTGGEPLVRRSIVDLVAGLNAIEGIDEIDITTNGLLLEEMAHGLKTAGLCRVNISLDTFDPDKFREITRGGDLQKVIRGIEAAEREGLTPVKINCVALGGFNDDEFERFIDLTRDRDITVRFIELMPIGSADVGEGYGFISDQDILRMFPELQPCEQERFSVSKDYHLPGAKGKVGFISALSHHFCSTCNKLRLTSDGKIKPCLHNNEEIDIKKALREGNSEDVIRVLVESIGHKVARHLLNEGAEPITRDMNKIGG